MAAKKTKPIRVIEIVRTNERPTYEWGTYPPSWHWCYKQYFYRVRSGGRNGPVLYHSENYASKTVAKRAAVREHEGRAKFQYVLEYPDRDGKTVVEKLK